MNDGPNVADVEDEPKLLARWTRIEARMLAVQPLLEKKGGIHERRLGSGRRVWVLRYRERVAGRVRQRSIYLGPRILADWAADWLGQWRAEADTLPRRWNAAVLEAAEDFAQAAGYSRRAAGRVKRAARAAGGDPLAVLAFLQRLPFDHSLRPGKRPGRPAKGRLW